MAGCGEDPILKETGRHAEKAQHQKRKMKKTIPLLLGLAVLGLIISVLLVRIHFQISVDPESKSFCHISTFLDCDSFLASPYARLGRFFGAELVCCPANMFTKSSDFKED